MRFDQGAAVFKSFLQEEEEATSTHGEASEDGFQAMCSGGTVIRK